MMDSQLKDTILSGILGGMDGTNQAVNEVVSARVSEMKMGNEATKRKLIGQYQADKQAITQRIADESSKDNPNARLLAIYEAELTDVNEDIARIRSI